MIVYPCNARPLRRYARQLLLFAGALAMSACAGLGARSDHDPQANFSELNTFAWQAPQRADDDERAVWDNDLLARRVAQAVRDELTDRGYREVAADEADFLVTYSTGERERTRGSSLGVGFGRGFGSRSSLFLGQQVHLDRRDEGVLVLDIIETGEQALIWRGWAARDVSDGRFAEEQVKRYVKGILERFPPS